MSNEHDHPRSHRNGTAGSAAETGRAGAGNTAARIYRRARTPAESTPQRATGPTAAGSLPFMDVMISGASGLSVQRREQAGEDAAADLSGHQALSIAAQGMSGPTAPLPHDEKMRAAFDGVIDFGALHVHRGDEAAQASEQLGAQAYTVGSSVALPAGSDEFTEAHELAHVAQQQSGKVQPRGVSSPDDADERQADAVASRVVAGEPIGSLLAAPDGAGASVQRREATDEDLYGPANAARGQVLEPAATIAVANALEKARASLEAVLGDARSKRVPLAIACAQALGLLSGVHHQIGSLSQQPRGGLPYDHAVQQLDGLYAAAWELHDLADGSDPYPAEADLLWGEMMRIASTGARIEWIAPAGSSEVRARQRAETACEPGSEEDPARRPACALDYKKRSEFRSKAEVGLMRVGGIFFDECKKQSDALRAAIARDQGIWGAIAGGAANVILAVLTGGVAAAGAGIGPAASTIGVGATAGAGGFAEARAAAIIASETAAAVPVASSEFGIAIRELGSKVASDAGKEVMRGMTRSAGRTSHDGRSGDERQQTIDTVGMLAEAFLSQLERVAHDIGALNDEQLIELKNAVLDTKSAQQKSAEFVATFVTDFRNELEPIGTQDFGSSLGAPPQRLPGVVHHRAIYVEDTAGRKRLALVRHVTDVFPGIRQAGRGLADGIARGVDAVTDGDTYDDQAWKEYRDDYGDEFYFERWIKNEDFQEIAGRGAPTIRASRVKELTNE